MSDTSYGILAGPYSMDFVIDAPNDPLAFTHNRVAAEVREWDDRRNTAKFQAENPLPKNTNPRDSQARIVRDSEKRAEAKRARGRQRKCKRCFTEQAPGAKTCFYCV